MTAALPPLRTPGKGHYRAPAPSAEVRESWDRFVTVKAVADTSLRYEDGRASALAFWDFVAAAGNAEGLAGLIGTLVPSNDPLAALLWSIAADLRRAAPRTLYALALHREQQRLTREREALLDTLGRPEATP